MQDGGPQAGDVAAQLQRELDDLAALVHHSVSLDGPDGTLLAYSAQATDVDPVRVAAILTRKVPADVLAYQRSHGIASAHHAVRIPANPALHMAARTCLPIRSEQRLAAYLWILDDDSAPIDAAALDLVAAAGERIARLLPAPGAGAIETQLAALLAGEPHPDLMDRLAELEARVHGRRLQLRCVIPLTVSGAERVPAPLTGSATDPAELVLGQVHAAGQTLLLMTERGGGPGGTGRSPAIGTGPGFRTAEVDIEQVARLAARAIVCAGCTATDAALPLRATWDDLGLYRQLLLTTRPDSWSGAELFGDDDPAVTLRHTLESYLDRGGDAARTIPALGIHRTTFYYRLERIRSLYGVDINDGLTRSELHVRLKLRRLALARKTFGWTTALLAHIPCPPRRDRHDADRRPAVGAGRLQPSESGRFSSWRRGESNP